MGNWAIVVHGYGAHHNKDYEYDADKMAKEFVKNLIFNGHVVSHSAFTFGAAEDIGSSRKATENENPPNEG